MPGEPYFWQKSFVVGAETTTAEKIMAKKTVVATGAWLSQLLDPIGVECYVKPRKRQVFSVKAESNNLKTLLQTTEFSESGLPFIVLANFSAYIRPNLESEGFGLGIADEFPRAFRLEEHPKLEQDFFKHGLLPVVSKHFPQFEEAVSSGGFAGLYEINTLDAHPVIFEEHNLIVVGGGSGSGIMKADAIGRIAAAVFAGEEHAKLFGGKLFKVSDLSLKNRRIEMEKLVI